MFSTQTNGLDGLEKFELEDLLSAITDIQKTTKDIEIKQKRGQSHAKEQKRRAEAVEELTSLFDTWHRRPYPEPRATVPVVTTNGMQVPNDPQARRAIRRMYNHLELSPNPVATRDESWLRKLEELSTAFVEFLPKSTAPDPDLAEIWEPKKRDPLAFEDLDPWRNNPPSFSPAPSLDDESMEEEDAGKEVALEESKNWNYYGSCRESEHMGKALSRVLGRVKKEKKPTEMADHALADEDDGGDEDDDSDPTYTAAVLPRHKPPPLPTKTIVKEEDQYYKCMSCGRNLLKIYFEEEADECLDCADSEEV